MECRIKHCVVQIIKNGKEKQWITGVRCQIEIILTTHS